MYNNFKKIILINLFIFFILFFILDYFLSNSIFDAKKNSCYQIEKFFYNLKKNCSGFDKFKSSFPTVKVFTDEQGLRIGKNTKKKNKEKVFIFGDSFTFGVGLKFEDTFTGILENKIKNFDFYNFAVGSYSPTVHLFNLETQIQLKNYPSKIIMFLDMTDVHDEAARWKVDLGKPILSNTAMYDDFNRKEKFFHKNFKVSRSFLHYINYQFRIYRSQINPDNLQKIKTSLQAGFTYKNLNELGNHYHGDTFIKGLEKIRDKIFLASNIAKKVNSEFYLVIYPYGETIEFGQDKFNWENFAEEICQNDKCKLINTFNAFINYKTKNKNWYSDLFFVGDEHFNVGGNKIIADELFLKIFSKY